METGTESRDGRRNFAFNRAEDRLAIGIIQALARHANERDLHSWISQLLNALETASKANESVSEAYRLDLPGAASVVQEAGKIPSQRGRIEFLTNCWVESLCTAEARVLVALQRVFSGIRFSALIFIAVPAHASFAWCISRGPRGPIKQ